MNKRSTVFLSYSRHDYVKVYQLYDLLVAAGYAPWMDTRNLLGGAEWETAIPEQIRASDFFVPCVSSSIGREDAFFRQEIEIARLAKSDRDSEHRFIIPVLLEPSDIPESLRPYHCVSLFEATGHERLLSALEEPIPTSTSTLPESKSRRAPALRKVEVTEPHLDSTTPPSAIPFRSFRRDIEAFLSTEMPAAWVTLSPAERDTVCSLGAKLEPIELISPATAVRLVTGFEVLALGAHGESFPKLCAMVGGASQEMLRLALGYTAIKTIDTFYMRASSSEPGVKLLQFTINVDPETITSRPFVKLLDVYETSPATILLEISERMGTESLRRLRELQVDFKLEYCADDLNNWCDEMRESFLGSVRATKIDNQHFAEVMNDRLTDPNLAIARLKACRVDGKPLVIEGIERPEHRKFLKNYWNGADNAPLYGQGYDVGPGEPWGKWTEDLRNFGLPGGYIIPTRHQGERLAIRKGPKPPRGSGGMTPGNVTPLPRKTLEG